MAGRTSASKKSWYDKLQHDTYVLLESPAGTNRARKFVIWFIATLIILNVIVVVLETVTPIYLAHEEFFFLFDLFTVIVFTLEYLLRVWCCVRNPQYAHPVRGRIRFALSPYVLVDLIALTPFYLPLIIPIEFRLLRMLRLLRIFRVIRLGRYSKAFETFSNVLISRKEELVIAMIMAIIIIVLASSAMYVVERDSQPDDFGSIPDSMWWAITTLSTVGYGDSTPITPIGKFLAAVVALSAIGLFALPAGILAHGFAESLNNHCEYNHKKSLACPRCGAQIDPVTGKEVVTSGDHGKSNTHDPSEESGEKKSR